MTGTSYVPGTWLGIVRSRTAVILGPETPAALAEGVWNLLAGKPEVYEVLQAITASAGGDLSRIPPFAILDFTGPLRVFLRGGLELTVGTPDGPVELDGHDVTTWSERSFAAPGEAILGVPGAGSTDHMQLRLGEGMVLLQQLRLGADAGQGVLEAPAPPAAEYSRIAGVDAADPGAAVLGAADNGAADPKAAGQETAADAAVPAGSVPGASVPGASLPGDSAAPAAVAVDSSGAAEVIAVAEAAEPGGQSTPGDGGASVAGPGGHGLPGPAEGAEPTAAAEEAAPAAPETTIAPGHGDVSVETVYAVLDEDGEYADAGAADHAGESGPAAAGTGERGTGALDADPAQPSLQEPGSQPAVDPVPAIDQTSSYDHLWERTVMRNIEDAAVREDPSDEDHAPALEAAALHAALGPGDGAAAAGHHDADHQHAGDRTPTAAKATAAQEPGAPESALQESAAQGPGRGADPANPAMQPPAEAPQPAAGLLIESVPWRTGGPATESAQAAPQFSAAPDLPQAPPAPPSPPAFGAVAPPPFIPAPSAEAGPPAAFDDDHDGQTVMRSSLPGAGGPQEGGGASGGPGPAAPAGAVGGPLVLARVCQQGHANPPIRSACTVCGASLPQDAVQVGRPRLGRMRLSTGELLDLDQSLVIGRQPSVSRVQGGVMPRLVQVPSPGGDISRSHVEVRLEGWHVMLCDLKATNGTVLVREGQPPRRLAQNEMAILLDGDIAELGDNISLRFEEIP